MPADNPHELLPLVDAQGKVTGSATRGECHNGSHLLHPVVHLHLFDSCGRLYLQRRPLWKDIQPGRWDTAVGGHIDLGESVGHALRREALEELGIDLAAMGVEPRLIDRYVFESDRESELINAYAVVADIQPRPTAELEGGRFWTQAEILASLGDPLVFTPNFAQEYRRFFLDRL